MFIKIFKRGTGNSGGIDYLTRGLDAEGEERSPQEKVLRGNPELTKSLIDSTGFKQRYTSGVLSFVEKDLPEKIKQDLIDSFEKEALFPGLMPDQYNSLWVEHRDKDRLELHFVVPNQELSTGKRLAPYYHLADMPRCDNWQEVKNFDFKLASPKEPERRKTFSLNKNLPRKKTEALNAINSNIEHMIQIGTIDNRDGVIRTLEGIGLVVHAGKNSISIKNPTKGKQNIRLKGAYYEQSFTSRGQLAGGFQKARDDYQCHLRENIKRAREKLAEQIKRKIEYHRDRYSPELEQFRAATKQEPEKSLDDIQLDIERDREQARENKGQTQTGSEKPKRGAPSALLDGSVVGTRFSLRDADGRLLPVSEHNSADGEDEKRARSFGEPAGRSGIFHGGGSQVSSFQGRTDQLLGDFRLLGSQTEEEIESGKYDGIRAAVNDWSETTSRAIREGSNQVECANYRIDTAGGMLEQAERKTDGTIQQHSGSIKRGIERMRENRSNELETFKTQINLVQYAAKLGYQWIKNESSRNCIAMKNGSGDKIIVATDQDGHGIYFSVSNNFDNGTIIDFHQKRTGDHLGNTRTALRQELSTGVESLQLKPRPADKTITGVIVAYAKMRSAAEHPYLINERKIPKSVINEPRFSNIRIDNKMNAVFPHFDGNGMSGYELKNSGFTGFSRGGKKSLWHSVNLHQAKEIVITESAIDSLSHASLHPRRDTAYISTGGSISLEQKELLSDVLKKAERNGQKVTLAFDNDSAGRVMTQEIYSLVKSAKQETPTTKDWNEDLQLQLEKQKQPRLDYGLGD